MAYVYQTFSVGQVLTAAQMQQVEDNIRDHVHGEDGVSSPTGVVLFDKQHSNINVVNTTTETTILSTTIPAGYVGPNGVLRFRIFAIIGSASGFGTVTMTLRFKIDSSTVTTAVITVENATASIATSGCIIEGLLLSQNSETSHDVHIQYIGPSAFVGGDEGEHSASTDDLSSEVDIEITAQFSNAHGTTVLRRKNCTIEYLSNE